MMFFVFFLDEDEHSTHGLMDSCFFIFHELFNDKSYVILSVDVMFCVCGKLMSDFP